MPSNESLAVYRAARGFVDGVMSRSEAIRLVRQASGCSDDIALSWLKAYAGLRKGELFQRAISHFGMTIFLDGIEVSEGIEGLRRAIQALELHIQFRRSRGYGVPGLADILESAKAKLEVLIDSNNIMPVYVEELSASLERKIAQSAELSIAARQARLRDAPKKPKHVQRLVTVLERNADVVVEVLRLANGFCASCEKPAPFVKKNMEPYLEVHHIIRLADDGDDTVENAEALCANCHRRKHHYRSTN